MDSINSSAPLKKGAEASLFLSEWQGRRVIIKNRFPKAYRPEKLDRQIRNYRTIHEAQLIHYAKEAGVPTPKILQVDVTNSLIIMEFVEGQQVKTLLPCLSKLEREKLCQSIGRLVGKLHKVGLVHGDLTTSNMIVNDEGRIVLIDFGLGEKSDEIEAKGVDLHLMKRALQSTHFQFCEECFVSIMNGYLEILGPAEAQAILDKIVEVERRGRYVAERKQELPD